MWFFSDCREVMHNDFGLPSKIINHGIKYDEIY